MNEIVAGDQYTFAFNMAALSQIILCPIVGSFIAFRADQGIDLNLKRNISYPIESFFRSQTENTECGDSSNMFMVFQYNHMYHLYVCHIFCYYSCISI